MVSFAFVIAVRLTVALLCSAAVLAGKLTHPSNPILKVNAKTKRLGVVFARMIYVFCAATIFCND